MFVNINTEVEIARVYKSLTKEKISAIILCDIVIYLSIMFISKGKCKYMSKDGSISASVIKRLPRYYRFLGFKKKDLKEYLQGSFQRE